MKQGGAVTVPQRVQDHFLAYINPGEAAALRAMGGGITAGGGQQLMNGSRISCPCRSNRSGHSAARVSKSRAWASGF